MYSVNSKFADLQIAGHTFGMSLNKASSLLLLVVVVVVVVVLLFYMHKAAKYKAQ